MIGEEEEVDHKAEDQNPVWNGQKVTSSSSINETQMTWSNNNTNNIDNDQEDEITTVPLKIAAIQSGLKDKVSTIICPSCGYTIKLQYQRGLHDLPGLPAGVKFDPTDQEILQHLEAKVRSDPRNLHLLIDEFIPTSEGENGICYTHPEKLPGVNKDGQMRHFFHRPSKAYTTGTRKRRKVHTDADGSETRWHKTGKTRPVTTPDNIIKGYKKILVLYTNYGRQRKPEKTNWVMHQYHLGDNEEEKDGELVVSKIFYQTQPRHCGGSSAAKRFSDQPAAVDPNPPANSFNPTRFFECYNNNNGDRRDIHPTDAFISYNIRNQADVMNRDSPSALIPNLVVRSGDGSSFIHLPSAPSKAK